MEAIIKEAIEANAKATINANEDEVAGYSQAVLNLCHALATLKGIGK